MEAETLRQRVTTRRTGDASTQASNEQEVVMEHALDEREYLVGEVDVGLE